MNIVHSKLCNRFRIRSVEVTLQIPNGLILENKTCVTFRPTEEMMKDFIAKDDSWSEIQEDDLVVSDMKTILLTSNSNNRIFQVISNSTFILTCNYIKYYLILYLSFI